MRKIPKEEMRPLIFMFSGVVFIVISFILVASAVAKSGMGIAVLIMMLGGAGLMMFGFFQRRKLGRSGSIFGRRRAKEKKREEFYLCDSCAYNSSSECGDPQRPNAISCRDYKEFARRR